MVMALAGIVVKMETEMVVAPFVLGQVVSVKLPDKTWNYGVVKSVILSKPEGKGELAYGVPWDKPFPLIGVDVAGRTLWCDGTDLTDGSIKLHEDQSVATPIKLIEELASISGYDEKPYFLIECLTNYLPLLSPFLGMMVRRSYERDAGETMVFKYYPSKEEKDKWRNGYEPSFTITINCRYRVVIEMNPAMAAKMNGVER